MLAFIQIRSPRCHWVGLRFAAAKPDACTRSGSLALAMGWSVLRSNVVSMTKWLLLDHSRMVSDGGAITLLPMIRRGPLPMAPRLSSLIPSDSEGYQA